MSGGARTGWRVVIAAATAAAAAVLLLPVLTSDGEDEGPLPAVPPTTSGPRFPLGLGPIDSLWSFPEFQSVDGVAADFVGEAPAVTARGRFAYAGRPGPETRDVIRRNELELNLPPFGGEFTGSATIGWWTVLRRPAPCNTTTEIAIALNGNYDAARGTLSGTFIPVHDHEVLEGCELATVPFADVIARDNFTGQVDADEGTVMGTLGVMPFLAEVDTGSLAGSLPRSLQLERIHAGHRGHEAWVALTFAEDWPPPDPVDDVIIGAVVPTADGTASFGFRIRREEAILFSGSARATTWFTTGSGVLVGLAQLPDDEIDPSPPTIVIAGAAGSSISAVHRFSVNDVPVLTGFVGNPLQVLDAEPLVDVAAIHEYWADGTGLGEVTPPPPPDPEPPPPPPAGEAFEWWRVGAAGAVLAAGLLLLLRTGRRPGAG